MFNFQNCLTNQTNLISANWISEVCTVKNEDNLLKVFFEISLTFMVVLIELDIKVSKQCFILFEKTYLHTINGVVNIFCEIIL